MILGLIKLTGNSPYLPVAIALVSAIVLYLILSQQEQING